MTATDDRVYYTTEYARSDYAVRLAASPGVSPVAPLAAHVAFLQSVVASLVHRLGELECQADESRLFPPLDRRYYAEPDPAEEYRGYFLGYDQEEVPRP